MTPTNAPGIAAASRAPRPAGGVEVLGPMAGSGYRIPPHLARRGDGQVLQLSPLLAAILEAIDGRRDAAAIADRVEETHGRALHPGDVTHLIDAKLRPLGLLAEADGSDPVVRRSNPLLGLRGRIVLTSADRTRRITGPFLWLFRPAVVLAVLVAFAGVAGWALLHHGLGSAVDDAMADPLLLLGLVALILASGAFHEIGHATACRYGGAAPGVMGAAVYLVWPAFYTDVTDSYRLDRAGRLRVDLGGLYFNAVFTVATGAAWAITGVEALLILVPVQLLQMVRQLVPIVRFDGYHILADLVGVPDLFARIRPTLARAVPWRRDPTPNPLTPRAQAVVVGWVVLVVPILLGSFGLLLWNLPAMVASALRSLEAQSELLRTNAADGRIAATALGVVAMFTVAFVPLSAAYLAARLAHRSGTRFWRVTDGRPMLRTATLALVALALVAAGPGFLPTTPHDGAADLAGAGQQVLGDEVVELATAVPPTPVQLTGTSTPTEADIEPGTTAEITEPELTVPAPVEQESVLHTEVRTGVEVDLTLPPVGPVVDRTVARPAWPFPFARPARPLPGDNQVLVVNTVDGTPRFAMGASLDWVDDGSMRNANEAYALASCTACRTVAVAFQIVASTTPTPVAIPENVAVAYNSECDACRTAAVAVQLAVTLEGDPSPEAKAALQQLVASVDARRTAFATASPEQIRAELLAAKAAALEILAPWVAGVEGDEEDAADTDGTADADGTTGAEDGTGTDDAATGEVTETGAGEEAQTAEGDAVADGTSEDGTVVDDSGTTDGTGSTNEAEPSTTDGSTDGTTGDGTETTVAEGSTASEPEPTSSTEPTDGTDTGTSTSS